MSKIGLGIFFMLLVYLPLNYGAGGMLLDVVLIILMMFYFYAVYIVNDGTENSIVTDKNLYIAVLFEAAGQICIAKGRISDEDRSRVYAMIKNLHLDSESGVIARYAFTMGQAKNYPLRARLGQLYRAYSHDRRSLMLFCKQMLELALIDGKLHHNERRILNIMADEFHISYGQMLIFSSQTVYGQGDEYRYYWQTKEDVKQKRQRERYKQRQQQFRQKQQYHQRQQDNRQKQHSAGQLLDGDAYQVLGVSANASVNEIKQAYRRLMNKHHPDKLVKQKLSDNELQQATERAQRIQAAYAYVKQLRGFV